MIVKRCPSSTKEPSSRLRLRRLPSGTDRPGRILPVTRPDANGLQTIALTPWPTPRGMRSNDNAITLAFDRRAEDFLCKSGGIDVGAVEHVQGKVEAHVDEARRLLLPGITPSGKKSALAAEGSGSKA